MQNISCNFGSNKNPMIEMYRAKKSSGIHLANKKNVKNNSNK
jgi:hypothetical protein